MEEQEKHPKKNKDAKDDKKNKITSLWLSLNLNYAVFLYKIKKNEKKGLKHLR
tara:strand:+ start:958 stop:1116 length:159 start_codon:yes stop_codon:yes gene_type:complete